MSRTLSPLDQAIGYLDQGIRLVFGPPPEANRPNPARKISDDHLTESGRDMAGRLMRINHCGEICAQALYQGQALTTNNDDVRTKLKRAADEENDHLAWTEERIRELGTKTSILNPIWYAGSFALGALAGAAGDRWNLGFLAETERQVVEHLQGHLTQLPTDDYKSRAIVEQMCEDEADHATTAVEAGAADLPAPIKITMRLAAKVMTKSSYWV